MKNRIYLFAIAAFAFCAGACDKFLDTMPDNRAEIDTEDKVAALLVSAYTNHNYTMVTELLADNMDNNREVVTSEADRFFQNIWNWADNTESNNESDENIWEDNWAAIAAANQALVAIEELGGPEESLKLAGSYGEALIARAYAHFILVNIFCLQYNEETSSTDLGLPYMDQPEQGLNPQYERSNVAEVYKRIDEDIQEGLKYVSDDYLVPKYHFNRQAALAFATRFYLFYGKYDLAIKYATECLGSAPQTMLRDYKDLQANYSTIADARIAYNSSESPANLLIQTGYSNMGLMWGNYSGSWKHYGFTSQIATTEGFMAPTPWHPGSVMTASNFVWQPKNYSISKLDYWIFWKIDYEFEYTDPVAGIGYRHTVYPSFTTDQCLLDRAEAYILSGNFQNALNDLNLWVNNFYTDKVDLTVDMIHNFYKEMPYYKWNAPTQKKHLNPRAPIPTITEGSELESMVHFVLNCRRTETIGLGQRWFDVKRYGIKIYRRHLDSDAAIAKVTDSLEVNDPRRALQIPQKSRDAGFEGNPR